MGDAMMSLDERAACIADLAGVGQAFRGEERRKRVYERALKMLREAVEVAFDCPCCGTRCVTEDELLAELTRGSKEKPHD